MESFETAAGFVDDLLDFSSDIGDGDEEEETNNKPFSSRSSSSSLPLNSNLTTTQQQKQQNHHHHHRQEQQQQKQVLNIFDSDHHPSVPEFLEEELEWLNEDAFPAVESLDQILLLKPNNQTKHQSPNSVLENSINNSSSSSNSSGIMSCCGNLRVPVRARSKRRRCRRSSFSDIYGQQLWLCEVKNKISEGGGGASPAAAIGRKCWHCFAEKTPQWRAGPFGPKTLCNACGVRYKSGRLVPEYRPASSPTFSSDMHSNSHRKILDMRRQKQKEMLLESFYKG